MLPNPDGPEKDFSFKKTLFGEPKHSIKKNRADKTEPDSIKIKDLIRLFTEFYMPKCDNYHNRRDFSGQDRPNTKHRRSLGTVNRNRKRISADELVISKYMNAITDKNVQDKMMKEKTLENKKIFELMKQITYEKKNKKNTLPEALILNKERNYKRRTNTKNVKTNVQRPKNSYT